MKDIAHEIGVSVTTVSHVINKTRNVNSETRKLVLDTMRRLDYDSPRSKRKANSASGLLGVIIADIREDYYVSIVKAIETVASENGLSILLCDSEMDRAKEEQNIQTILSRDVAGLIIAPIDSRFFPEELRTSELPIVLVDRQYDEHNRTFVGINNFESGAMAFRHLENKGCSRIGFIGYPDYVYSVHKRALGYKAGILESANSRQPQVLVLHYDKEDSFTLISDFIRTNSFDGLICATSDICYETISVIHEMGIAIPESIKLLTYDDNKWLDYLRYPISVISQPTAEIGAFAVEKIIRFLTSPSDSDHIKTEVFFDISIIDR
jgi:LacI family transcriptional regulator